jgi:hypothetical protein
MAEATTTQRKLTDRYLASIKGASAPYDIRDTEVPGSSLPGHALW